MRLLLFILLICNVAYSQQLVTLCYDEPQTYSYSAQADLPGQTEWQVNGTYYYGPTVDITWSDTGVYVISAVHYALNCPSDTVTYTVTVELCKELTYFIPNTFTPDGDERNQTWKPVFSVGVDLYDYQLFVFNRWGEMIWESHDPTSGWDGTYAGTLCQDGIYTWVISFGDLYTDARYMDRGHLTIIR